MIDDDFRVEAKTWLRRSTYKSLYAAASVRGMSLDQLLSEICDVAVKTRPKKRTWTRMTPELLQRARELEATGMTYARIAEEIGVSKSTLANHREQLRRQQ